MSNNTVEYSFDSFVHAHQAQLLAADVPSKLWPVLFRKLVHQTFDAGEYLSLVVEEGVSDLTWSALASQPIHPDLDNIFLIDHAWTFKIPQIRRDLRANDALFARVARMVGVVEAEDSDDEYLVGNDGETTARDQGDRNDEKKELMIDKIMDNIWKYVNTYTLKYKKEMDEESTAVWYLMDELGSSISHSRTPNCRLVPFYFTLHAISYSLLFFIDAIGEQDEVTRDFTESLLSLQHPEWIDILQYPWEPREFSDLATQRPFPSEDFFQGGRVADILPSEESQKKTSPAPSKPLKVYADDTQFIEKLRKVEYKGVNDWREADVLWLRSHFHDYKALAEENPSALVNQFPCECCLTTKDLLAALLCRGGAPPDYFPLSFNLNTELPQFVAHFQERAKSGEDNTWIIKPWNLARGLDMHVTDNLSQIIRLIESGPKIASKYIENPVLFHRKDLDRRVKFDLRFILFVNSIKPLEAHVYDNFWIRFAINEFVMDRFEDEQTHFTVFNYSNPDNILQMKWEEFVRQLEETYPTIKWKEVEKDIHSSFRHMLSSVSELPPPRGIPSNAQSRAMYGIDVMLRWTPDGRGVAPSILEVNFMPDCTRACSYYPDFADVSFETMFGEKPTGTAL